MRAVQSSNGGCLSCSKVQQNAEWSAAFAGCSWTLCHALVEVRWQRAYERLD